MLAPTMPPPMMTTWARSGICLAMYEGLRGSRVAGVSARLGVVGPGPCC